MIQTNTQVRPDYFLHYPKTLFYWLIVGIAGHPMSPPDFREWWERGGWWIFSTKTNS